MTTSFADGLSEEEFRRSIEARLRENRPEEAVNRLRRLLASEAGPGGILPERFLTVQSSDLVLDGWNDLATRIRAYDEPGRPITAISIAFGWPGEESPQPDEQGRLRPHVETEYFNDAAYPFSESDRDNLLEGYSYYGCTWAGEGKATDTTLKLGGIDDLHGALAQLEMRLLAMDEPDEDEIRAGSLGACLLSVLLFQAVRDRLARDPMPRPVCVMSGSNGVYPYFDAPVCGMPAHALKDEAAELNSAAAYIPGPRYSSLLVTGIPRARKRAVLVVEETETETAARIANLRGLHHRDEVPDLALPEPLVEPEPELAELVPDDGTIIPNPGGPLLVKRKPSQSWDFRDLLTPEAPSHEARPEPEMVPIDFAPDEMEPTDEFPNQEWDLAGDPPGREPPSVTEIDQPDWPPEPEAEHDWNLPPAPPPTLVDAVEVTSPDAPATIQPGFTSFTIDLDIESRLKALIAAQTGVPEPEPEPDPVVEARAAGPDVGPAWPLGIRWLEEVAEPVVVPATEPAPRPSLLMRLLNLLPRRR